MVLHEKMTVPYDAISIRSLVWLRCDYCETEFERVKKTRGRLNKNNPKDSCGAKKCSNQKRQESFVAQCGSPSYLQSPEFIAKQKAANVVKFGTEVYFASDDFREKRKIALVEKYGVESPLQSPVVREKMAQTCLARYGTEYFSQTEGIAERRAASCLKKHGVTTPMLLPEVQDLKKKTCAERYGVADYTKTPECQEKKRATCRERYGVDHPSKLPENRGQARDTCQERYGAPNYSQTAECKARVAATCIKRYGVPNPFLLPENQIYGRSQAELQEWVNGLGFAFAPDYEIMGGKEIDLLDRKPMVGIEYCGLYWHNEMSPTPRDAKYHFAKHEACRLAGVTLFTIFEDEWLGRPAQCKAVLRASLGQADRTYQARQCEIGQLDKKKTADFLNANHLQGASRRSQVQFALTFGGEMVGVMTLGTHHRQTTGIKTIVLDRLCFAPGVRIIGGASRLLSRCKEWAVAAGYEEIITWSDNRWSAGKVYGKIGFTLDGILPPDYSYVDSKRPGKRLSKQSQKKSLTGCPEERTERDWAASQGLGRIWDCGKMRWKLSLKPAACGDR